MSAPLNASASQAGALISNSRFEVPQFQREYSWQPEEVEEFWSDLQSNLDSGYYFLGLIILTDENGIKHVVDGQQRIITLTLLATALFFAAKQLGRKALAERIESDFLRSIDYETDEKKPRVILSAPEDNQTFQHILDTGNAPTKTDYPDESVSSIIVNSYTTLQNKLQDDLRNDAFKRLGKWTDFLTNQLYFAVFVHPDPASAYQVFEVINTRGKELTTADLLKNYILSQTPKSDRQSQYGRWRAMSRRFAPDGSTNTFVQFIRHAVTVRSGHILPKDLYIFLANKRSYSGKKPPSPPELMDILEQELPLYIQMIDPTASGPAEGRVLQTFLALNSLGVIAVRPILLALLKLPDAWKGIDFLLRLVVRRIVVGNLGTGNVERRFGEAARTVYLTADWTRIVKDLSDLNPSRDEFVEQLRKRSYNKNTISFMRRSIVQKTTTPENEGTLHFIWPRNTTEWTHFFDEDSYWGSTIGNSILAAATRRPKEATEDWAGFQSTLLLDAAPQEWTDVIGSFEEWSATAIEQVGKELAEAAAAVWYGEQ